LEYDGKEQEIMRVVAYCRYSSEAQRDGFSIEAQIRAIEEYCEKNEHILIAKYIDEARSATTDQREQFQAMINDSGKGRWDAIVVHKLDRFARNRYDSAVYKKRLKDNGVRILSVTEHLDDSPESAILESVLEGMAEYYSRNLSRETKKGKREAARQGRYTGGGIPMGYDIDEDNRFVINPKEAKIIKDLFDKIAGGMSLYQTAKYAVKKGYRNKNGNFINIYFIRHMLRNPIYAGRLVYGKKPHTGEGEFYVDNACEPIVDPDLFWTEYHKAMSRNTGPVPKKKSNTDYILTGFAYCGYCGTGLRGHSKTYKQQDKKGNPRYHYEQYRCPRVVTSKRHFEPGHPGRCQLNYMDREILEQKVIEDVVNLVEGKNETWNKVATELMEKTQKRIDEATKKIEYNDKEIDRLVYRTENLLNAFLDGEFTKEEFHDKNAEFSEQINEMSAENDRLQRYVASLDIGAIKKSLNTFNSNMIKDASAAGRRKLLSGLVERIIVTNEEIKIVYKVDIEPFAGLVSNGGAEGIHIPLNSNDVMISSMLTV
jgi:DNA invertase Pin-like site-specific DNA recombinase